MTRTHSPFQQAEFNRWFEVHRSGLVHNLADFVSIDTTSPNEESCFPWLKEQVTKIGGAVRQQAPPAEMHEHPFYTFSPFVESAKLRNNLRTHLVHKPNAPSVLFNAHTDVVPAAPELFSPRLEEGRLFGRGSADTKGNVIMLLAAIQFLQDADIPIAYDIHADFVVEEEFGGNGTLATVIEGCPAKNVVVLEPTGLAVHRGHRGCLAFELSVSGRAAHMGAPDGGLSAIDGAFAATEALRRLEHRLQVEARAHQAFAEWARPVHVNVGSINGGEWHGSIPDNCVLKGNLGFLPEYGVAGAKELLHEALQDVPEVWQNRMALSYSGIHNEGCLTPPDARIVRALSAARERHGLASRPADAWNVSCDARFYPLIMNVPIAIFGCGRLADAHSNHEHVQINELRAGAAILADLLSLDDGSPQ